MNDAITRLERAMQDLPRPDLEGERPSSDDLQQWIGFAGECMDALRAMTP